MKEVTDVLSISRTTIYDMISNGTFPKKLNLTERIGVFVKREIDQFLVWKATELPDEDIRKNLQEIYEQRGTYHYFESI